MQITLICASGIRDTGFIGIQDPYVRIKHGKVKEKSRVCKDGGTAPRWSQTIHIEYFENQGIEFSIKNSNLLKDDMIGTATMDSIQLKNIKSKGGEGEQVTLPVFTQENRQKGEIQVKISFPSEVPREFVPVTNPGYQLHQAYPQQPVGVAQSSESYPGSAPYPPPSFHSNPSNLTPQFQQQQPPQYYQYQQQHVNNNYHGQQFDNNQGYGQQQVQYGQSGNYPRIGYDDQ